MFESATFDVRTGVIRRAAVAVLRDLLERAGSPEYAWASAERMADYSNAEMFEALSEVMMLNPITIPAGTPARACLSCGEAVYWTPHAASGRNHSVSIRVEFGEAPTAERDGTGVQHLANCPKSALRDTQG